MSSRPFRFDLEKAIATWRHVCARRRAFSAEDLEELERHVRDHTAHLLARGYDEEAAFQEAVRALGDVDGGEAEYRKVRWGKLRRQHRWQHELQWSFSMLKNYFITALRNLLRQKGYAFINLFGLGIGIAASLLIFLYARHELTYDRFHHHADRIYQVYKERITPAGTQVARDTWVPLLGALQRDFPAVESGVRLWSTDLWVRHGDRRYQEQVTYADADLLSVFSFILSKGDPSTILDDPFSIVLSEEIARKYFGDAEPLGKNLTLDHVRRYTVTGVLAPMPSNSSIQPDFVIPITSAPWYQEASEDWGNSFLETYLLLAEDADPADLQAQFPAFIARIWDAETAARTNFKLEVLPNLYDAINGNRKYAYILLGIAFAILLIAAINFTNLATARSLDRAREIGVRKALGAHRKHLVQQFLGESIVLSLFALVLGVLLAELALPAFNGLYGFKLSIGYASDPSTLAGLLALGLCVGLAAGGYPALYLSGLQPTSSLQGSIKSGRAGLRLRSGLIVVQFALSIALIAGTLIVRSQIGYMQEADLQFEKENVVAIQVEVDDFEDAHENAEAGVARLATFREEVARQSSVVSVASSSHIPGRWEGWFTFVRPEGWEGRDPLRVRVALVDDQYFQTYGIPFVEGRAFSRDTPSDRESAVIINEAALRAFGWRSAAGKTVRRGDTDFQVIGVVRDYHFESLQNETAPVLHFYRPPESGTHSFISVRLRPGSVTAALDALRRQWRTVDPDRPLPYSFVDDQFARLYESEERLAASAGAFTLFAILIASLGLFGLAALTAEQRTKEIGIRKVLGASAAGIVALLSKDFLKLVLLAFTVAVPVAYLAMQRWLEGFAYRIEIGPGVFLLAGVLVLLVALATVSYQAIKAALADPVKSLRYE